MRTSRKFLIAALVLVAWGVAFSSFYTINETQVGVVTRFGRPLPDYAEPGLHVKLPWPIDAVVRLDRRLLVFDNEPAEMLTRDKKNVLVDSFVCWRIVDPLRFEQTVKTRLEAEARLLDLTASELGAAVGSEPMESFLNVDAAQVKLREVAARAAMEVDAIARESFGIEVVDLQINGFNLPRQNRASVIDRMRAERARIATAYRSEGEEEALKVEAQATAERERILAQARAEAEAIRGQGEAGALEIMGRAYSKDPEFYKFLRSLESYEKIIDENTTVFIESDSPLMETLHGR
jgi:membrane protease subunit HflC